MSFNWLIFDAERDVNWGEFDPKSYDLPEVEARSTFLASWIFTRIRDGFKSSPLDTMDKWISHVATIASHMVSKKLISYEVAGIMVSFAVYA